MKNEKKAPVKKTSQLIFKHWVAVSVQPLIWEVKICLPILSHCSRLNNANLYIQSTLDK